MRWVFENPPGPNQRFESERMVWSPITVPVNVWLLALSTCSAMPPVRTEYPGLRKMKEFGFSMIKSPPVLPMRLFFR